MADATFERLNAECMLVTGELVLGENTVLYLGRKDAELAMIHNASITLAASETTDGMDITIICINAADVRVPGVHALEVWMSESIDGIGLTEDSYSGDMTAATGTILTAYTAKKHFSVLTAATGIAVLTLVDSANPADQYVAVKNPIRGKVHVSAASGTSWQGA